MKVYVYFIVVSMVFLTVVYNEDYIRIKNKKMVPHSNQESGNNPKHEENKNLEEVEDMPECKYYDIKEMYRCKTCLKFLTDVQKSLHTSEHIIEKIKVGERAQCQICKRLFVGGFTTYCPKCKGKLKLEIVEIEEAEENGEKHFFNKKTKERICQKEKIDEKNISHDSQSLPNSQSGK